MAASDLTVVDPSASDPSAPEPMDRASTPRVEWVIPPGIFASVSLVYLTLSKFGAGGLGAAWSVAQVLLVFVGCFDVVTRRIPNRATIPAMAVVVVLRAVFASGTVPEALLAGVGGFAAFFFLFVVTRGGFGMGDAKLAGLLGLLLGSAVLPALLVGIVAGGIASAVVVVAVRGGRKQAIAYGPYLCLGAALGILAFNTPPLV